MPRTETREGSAPGPGVFDGLIMVSEVSASIEDARLSISYLLSHRDLAPECIEHALRWTSRHAGKALASSKRLEGNMLSSQERDIAKVAFDAKAFIDETIADMRKKRIVNWDELSSRLSLANGLIGQVSGLCRLLRAQY